MTCKDFACLMDSYLSEKLSSEKQEEFELHYFECDQCFTQLKVAERLKSKEIAINVNSRETASQWLKIWTWKPLLAAASILFIAFSLFLFFQHSAHMNQMYKISTFSPPVYFLSETRGLNSKTNFPNAMHYYSKGKYLKALSILKSLDNNPKLSKNPQVTFFKGICFLITDDLKEAIKEFDLIIENMNPSYYDEAIYYKSIALLRMNKIKHALEHLNHLAEMFSPFSPRARQLIKKVKSLN